MTDHAPAPRWVPTLEAYRCAECEIILVEVRRWAGAGMSLSFRHPRRVQLEVEGPSFDVRVEAEGHPPLAELRRERDA